MGAPLPTERLSTTVNGMKFNGNRLLLPGFEEFDLMLVKPGGSKAKATKHGYMVIELGTGKSVHANTFDNPREAMEAAQKSLNRVGVDRLRAMLNPEPTLFKTAGMVRLGGARYTLDGGILRKVAL